MNDRPMGTYATITWTALRVVAGFLLMSHGVQKLFGWIGGMDGAGQAAAFPALPWFAGVIETFGGLLVLLGLFTRPVAFLLAGELAVAYFMVHAPQAFWPSQNHGEPAALFSFIFLAISGIGPGPWSIDRAFRR